MIWIVPVKLVVIVVLGIVIAWIVGVLLSSLVTDYHRKHDNSARH